MSAAERGGDGAAGLLQGGPRAALDGLHAFLGLVDHITCLLGQGGQLLDDLLPRLQRLLEGPFGIVEAVGQLARIGDHRHQCCLDLLDDPAVVLAAFEGEDVAGIHGLRRGAGRQQVDGLLADVVLAHQLRRAAPGNALHVRMSDAQFDPCTMLGRLLRRCERDVANAADHHAAARDRHVLGHSGGIGGLDVEQVMAFEPAALLGDPGQAGGDDDQQRNDGDTRASGIRFQHRHPPVRTE
ncbi:hypothetical protein WKW79_34265 [Variovorax robiniae]|uniref:Uncharacterized protein n=1 Tax=Variovorax robiniae TaxID=1836199 RepID=A0ABU8XIF6_9BURK